MLAPGTAAPVESSTLPETDGVTCARIVPAAKQMQKKTPAKACVSGLLSDSILHHHFLSEFLGGLYSPYSLRDDSRLGANANQIGLMWARASARLLKFA